ncbi:hypothetical protein [Agromyces sp. NPDC058126]|uniref:hypothetical protein n=1 Tax=Agromyces sp. NPDC058126 TaxID=3346350 RepID=UPI0036DE37BF
MTDSPKLEVRDLRILARLCDAMRAMTLSGRIDPDTISMLRRRIMSVEPSDDGGSDEAVLAAHLERIISRLRDELGADY